MSLLFPLGGSSYQHTQPALRLDHTNRFTREPRWTLQIAFDMAETDLLYLKSHSNSAIPAGGTSYSGMIKEFTERTQEIKVGISEVGQMTLTIVDQQGKFSAYLGAKLQGYDALRNKTIRIFEGENNAIETGRDMDWSEYENTGTYSVKNISYDKGIYTIACSDISRDTNVNVFDLAQTNITATIETTATTISVVDTSKFSMLTHGNSFSDAPSQRVGYLEVDHPEGKIFIRYTGTTPNSFTGCTIGVLGSVAKRIEIDATKTNDHKTKIKELVYLEMPLPKLIYFLLTGVQLFGPAGATPDTWHGGIDPNKIQREDFLQIGLDVYNPSDDTQGVIPYFIGEQKQNLKQFIEEQIYSWGFYSPIYNDGKMGLRRRANLALDTPEHLVLDETVVSNASSLAVLNDMESVINLIKIKWNYDHILEDTLRTTNLIDADSQVIYQQTRLREFILRGLHGSRHSTETIKRIFGFMRDRYASAPYTARIKLKTIVKGARPGQLYRWKEKNTRDYHGPLAKATTISFVAATNTIESAAVNFITKGFSAQRPYIWVSGSANVQNNGLKRITAVAYTGGVYKLTVAGDMPLVNEPTGPEINIVSSLDRTFEVVNVGQDRINGTTSLSLLGSTDRGTNYIEDAAGYSLSDASYTSRGTDLNIILAITGGTVTADHTLYGDPDLHKIKSWFYYNGDLTIGAGVTLTIDKNVVLVIKGVLTLHGTINGAGNGKAGKIAPSVSDVVEQAGVYNAANVAKRYLYDHGNLAEPGFFGITLSPSPLYTKLSNAFTLAPYVIYPIYMRNQFQKPVGGVSAVPLFSIGADSGGSIPLLSMPQTLMGTAGSSGKASVEVNINVTPDPDEWTWGYTAGGNGGNSGAGLAIICRGMTISGSGKIITSGSSGGLGSSRAIPSSPVTYLRGGPGAGGAPGALLILIDGYASPFPSITPGTFEAFMGANPLDPGDYAVPAETQATLSDATYFGPSNDGHQYFNAWQSAHRIQFIPPHVAVEGETDYEYVAPPTNLAAESGNATYERLADGTIQPRIKVTWTPSVSTRIKGYRVEYSYIGTTVWTTVSNLYTSDINNAYLPLAEGSRVSVRVKAFNLYNKESAYATLAYHIVKGYSVNPPQVTSIDVRKIAQNDYQVSWVMRNKPDNVVKYRIRYSIASSTQEWDDMLIIGDGDVSGTTYVIRNLPPGDYRVSVKAVDTQGRESDDAQSATISVASMDSFLSIVPVDEYSGGWGGTKYQCYVDGSGYLRVSDYTYTYGAGNAAPWTSFTPSTITSEQLFDIIYMNALDVWIVCGSTGYCAYSSNDGGTWTNITAVTTNALRGLVELPMGKVLAYGDAGTILIGDVLAGTWTWETVGSGTTENLTTGCIGVTNAGVGYSVVYPGILVGGENNTVIHSMDGYKWDTKGWNIQHTEKVTVLKLLVSPYFQQANIYIQLALAKTASGTGVIFYSHDFGQSWGVLYTLSDAYYVAGSSLDGVGVRFRLVDSKGRVYNLTTDFTFPPSPENYSITLVTGESSLTALPTDIFHSTEDMFMMVSSTGECLYGNPSPYASLTTGATNINAIWAKCAGIWMAVGNEGTVYYCGSYITTLAEWQKNFFYPAFGDNPRPKYIRYETGVKDLGAIASVVPHITSAFIAGTGMTGNFWKLEVSTSTDGTTYTAYAEHVPGQVITARYLKYKVSAYDCRGTWYYGLASFLGAHYIATISEYKDNVDVSTYSGSTGNRTIPLTKTYKAIQKINVNVQNIGTDEWRIDVVSKATTGPNIKFYKLVAGTWTLTDPAVTDIEIIGYGKL